MCVIENYEAVDVRATGEVLLTTSLNRMLTHPNGVELEANLVGRDLITRRFRIKDLPDVVLSHLAFHGEIRLAEFGNKAIDRLAILRIA